MIVSLLRTYLEDLGGQYVYFFGGGFFIKQLVS